MLTFSQDDWAFIHELDKTQSGLVKSFQEAFIMKPEYRMQNVQGYLINLPNPFFKQAIGTAFQHASDTVNLARETCKGYDEFQKLSGMIYFADFARWINRTPSAFNEDDNKKLNTLAARIIFEPDAAQKQQAIYQEYLAQDSTTARLATVLKEAQNFMDLENLSKGQPSLQAKSTASDYFDVHSGHSIETQLKFNYHKLLGYYDAPVKTAQPKPII